MPRSKKKRESHNSDFSYTFHPMLQAEYNKVFPEGRTSEYAETYHAHIVLDEETGLYLLTVYPGEPIFDAEEKSEPIPYVLVYDERDGGRVDVADLSVEEFEKFLKELDWRDERYTHLNHLDYPARYKHVMATFDLTFFDDAESPMSDEIWNLQDDVDAFLDHCDECKRKKKLDGEEFDCSVFDQNLCAMFWLFSKLRK